MSAWRPLDQLLTVSGEDTDKIALMNRLDWVFTGHTHDLRGHAVPRLICLGNPSLVISTWDTSQSFRKAGNLDQGTVSYTIAFAPNEDSDQLSLPCSLIRVFAKHLFYHAMYVVCTYQNRFEAILMSINNISLFWGDRIGMPKLSPSVIWLRFD